MAKKWRFGKIRKWAEDKRRMVRISSEHGHGEHVYHGTCVLNDDHTERAPGERLYETHVPSRYGEAGHVVKVVPLRGTRKGAVVDVSSRYWDVGRVRDIRDEKGILETLSELFSVGGWGRWR